MGRNRFWMLLVLLVLVFRGSLGRLVEWTLQFSTRLKLLPFLIGRFLLLGSILTPMW